YFDLLNLPVGTSTWQTKVILDVPQPVIGVNDTGEFFVHGIINNFSTALLSDPKVATVFGSPTFPQGNLQTSAPFTSTITIDGNKIFVGSWEFKASDLATSDPVLSFGPVTVAGIPISFSTA